MKFNFCPKCRARINGTKASQLHCWACGFKYYFNQVPTVAAILTNGKGELLLAKRNKPPRKGSWDLPGGFLKLNESLEKALERELEEELGFKINKYKYIASSTDRYKYLGLDYQVLVTFFAARIKQPDLRANEEISELKFFSSNSIPYSRLSFVCYKSVLRSFFLEA